jgi:dihydrofolate reductase
VKPHIGMIWAQARELNGSRFVVGANGGMPWHVPEDLAHFKKTTLGAPVIMGRATWDSLPPRFRPLPGRLNVVLSRQNHAIDAASVEKNAKLSASSLDSALSICEQTGADQVWVIGGAQVYAQAMPLADELVVTQLDAEVDGDAFAPPIDDAVWELVHSESITSAQGVGLKFERYARRQHTKRGSQQ